MVEDCVFVSEFGVRRKNGFNPGSAGLEFRERPVPFSELRTLAGSEFGVRTGPNPGSAGSEFRERPVSFSHNSEPWLGERTRPNPGLAGSEKGQFLSLNCEPLQVRRKDRAKPWFGSFRVRQKDRAKPWFCRFEVRRNTGYFLLTPKKRKK